MPGCAEVGGYIVVVDSRGEEISTPEHCVYDWLLGDDGVTNIRIRSFHNIPLFRRGRGQLKILDADKKPLWTDPGEVEGNQMGRVLVEHRADGLPTIVPGQERTHAIESFD